MNNYKLPDTTVEAAAEIFHKHFYPERKEPFPEGIPMSNKFDPLKETVIKEMLDFAINHSLANNDKCDCCNGLGERFSFDGNTGGICESCKGTGSTPSETELSRLLSLASEALNLCKPYIENRLEAFYKTDQTSGYLGETEILNAIESALSEIQKHQVK